MRLNCGIPVEYLTDEHLFAEQRELKMLPSLFKRIGFKSLNKSPNKFTLGKGHMLFGLYRPTYILNRYNQVFNECIKRGYKIEYEGWRWDVYKEFKKDYIETGEEKYILIERITERIKNSPKKYFHYNHNRISKDSAISILNQLL